MRRRIEDAQGNETRRSRGRFQKTVQATLDYSFKRGNDVVMKAASTTPPPHDRHEMFEIVRATSERVNRKIQIKKAFSASPLAGEAATP